MTNKDDFETDIPQPWLDLIIQLGTRIGFDPLSSVEMERWIKSIIQEGERCAKDVSIERIARAFICAGKPPNWMQASDWQVNQNGPMVFVGQIECHSEHPMLSGDPVFYVFYDPHSGEKRTVIQS